jgi:hypothetical protein
MDRDTIIDGLRMTMDLCVFDPSTGEEIEPHLLNDINRATYDACKGALEILERLDTDSDTISRQAAIGALDKQIEQCDKALSSFDISMRDGFAVKVERASLVAFREILEYLPSAQPEIVRCKDCRHFKQVFAPNDNDGLCGHWHSKCDARTNRNDYCSHAERREVTT